MTQAVDYNAIPALNWSSLCRMDTSPLLYRWRADHPEPDTEAFLNGRALHCAVLEPERWKLAFAPAPEVDRRTKEGKAAYAEFAAALPTGCEVIPAEKHLAITRAAESIHRHRVARELLRGGTAERVVQWTAPGFGIACKARVDYLRTDFIVELKSTRDVQPRRFERLAAGYLYHGQIAYYHDGALEAREIQFGADRPHVITVELTGPYDVACYRVSDTMLATGRALYRNLLGRWQECKASNHWPGCAPDLLDLELPPWVGAPNEEQSEEW